MQLTLPPAVLGFFSFEDLSISPLLIPIVSVLGGCAIAIVAMYLHYRKRELWHQTARLALEKGQPVPQFADDPPSGGQRGSTPQNDLRAGLIMIATGAGLYFFLDNFLGSWIGYVGFIPGFIGVALLLHGLLSLMFGRKSADRPPQA